MLKKSFKFGFIPRVLMKNPGTYEMLEKVYMKQSDSIIDRYFVNSHSGQALRNRLKAITSFGTKKLSEEIAKKKQIKIVNYGCGTARDTIGIVSQLNGYRDRVNIDCIDVDSGALTKAIDLCKEMNLKNFNFYKKSMMRVRYNQEVDIGLLIGILCGLTIDQCVSLLERIKPHFRKDGILIASCVLKQMKRKDSNMAYVLRRIIDWKLIYKTPEQLKEIFEAAGYKWHGCFYDEPLRYHAMGIGTPMPSDIKNF